MNAALCTPAALAYNGWRGVRNLVDGTRPDSCGFFVFTPAINPSMVGGPGNITNTRRRLNAVLNLRPPIIRASALTSETLRSAIMASSTPLLFHVRNEITEAVGLLNVLSQALEADDDLGKFLFVRLLQDKLRRVEAELFAEPSGESTKSAPTND